MNRTSRVLLLLGLVAIAIATSVSFPHAKADGGGGSGTQICPQIYAPVICDHGRIFPNQCEADAHHAHHCVPYGGP